jgi:type IV pilus assembly protein PilE
MQSTLKKSSGFTLVELIVAMVIAAILAAVAIPAYSNYVRKARRTEVKTALLDLASLEERSFSVNNSYTTSATALSYAAWPVTLPSGYYVVAQPVVVAATTNAAATYTLSATVTGDQTKDTQCQSFTLNSAGSQAATPDAPGTCWR